MLQKLRDQTQTRTFQVIVILLILSLALFGFGAFNVFLTRDVSVASVDGEDISQAALARGVERERRRVMMQTGEADSADPVTLQGPVREQLIAREVLRQALDDFGIRAAKATIDRAVIENPNFQAEGQFNDAQYRRTVQALGYAPQEYLEETGLVLGIEQLSTGIGSSALMPDWEVRLLAGLFGQRRDLAYLEFTNARFEKEVELADEDVAQHYADNERRYVTEESLDVAWVVLDWDQLLDDPSIAVDEQRVAAEYESEKAAAPDPEQRRSSHILITAGDRRDDDAAIALLSDLRERVVAGESFEALADEYSEDPGSATSGGDIGLVGRGILDPAFEEALWSLEVGQVSEPVKTEFGYHIIRLDDIEVREYPSFEDQRAGIETRLRRAEAEALYNEKLRELDNLAFEQYDALEGIAAALELEIQTTPGVTREAGEGVFESVELRDAVFADEVRLKGNNTAAVALDETRAVVARVVDRHEPVQRTLDDVREEIVAELKLRRAEMLADEAHDLALARLEAGESVAEVARAWGLEWQTFDRAPRNLPGVDPSIVLEAFDLPRPVGTGKSIGTTSLAAGQAVVVVTRVVDGELANLSDAEAEAMRRGIQARNERLVFGAVVDALRAEADIERL
jgi:peptidyl-prolyl cis-trans isomerase D